MGYLGKLAIKGVSSFPLFGVIGRIHEELVKIFIDGTVGWIALGTGKTVTFGSGPDHS